MAAEPLKPDHRVNLVAHIIYELEMLIALHDWLVSHGKPKPEERDRQIEHNSRIESFVVHFRNMHEFFFNDERHPHPKNVRADRYVADWLTEGRKGIGKSQVVRDSAERADYYIMHLSTMRVEEPPSDYPWDVPKMLCGLRPVTERFFRLIRKQGGLDSGKTDKLEALSKELASRCGEVPSRQVPLSSGEIMGILRSDRPSAGTCATGPLGPLSS